MDDLFAHKRTLSVGIESDLFCNKKHQVHFFVGMGVGMEYNSFSMGMGHDLFGLNDHLYSYLTDVASSVSKHQINKHLTSATLLYQIPLWV